AAGIVVTGTTNPMVQWNMVTTMTGGNGGSGGGSATTTTGGRGGDAGTAVAIEVANSVGTSQLFTNTAVGVTGGAGGLGGNGGTTNGNGGTGGDADAVFLISARNVDTSGNSLQNIRGGTGGNGAVAGGGSGNGGSGGGDRGDIHVPGLLVEPGHHDARRPRWGLPHRDEWWPRRRCLRRHFGTRLEWPLRGGYDLKRDERRSGQRPPDPDVVCGRILPHRQQDVQGPLHCRQRDAVFDRELRVLRGQLHGSDCGEQSVHEARGDGRRKSDGPELPRGRRAPAERLHAGRRGPHQGRRRKHDDLGSHGPFRHPILDPRHGPHLRALAHPARTRNPSQCDVPALRFPQRPAA